MSTCGHCCSTPLTCAASLARRCRPHPLGAAGLPAAVGRPGRWLINLEELPSAVPMVQAALYQLVLDRKVGEYELPEGASLIACGNRETDRGVVHRMPTPLASRFFHLEIRVDAEDWLAWGAANPSATLPERGLYPREWEPRQSSDEPRPSTRFRFTSGEGRCRRKFVATMLEHHSRVADAPTPTGRLDRRFRPRGTKSLQAILRERGEATRRTTSATFASSFPRRTRRRNVSRPPMEPGVGR